MSNHVHATPRAAMIFISSAGFDPVSPSMLRASRVEKAEPARLVDWGVCPFGVAPCLLQGG